MPLYRYQCAECEASFEELVFGEEEPRCPQCEGADVERLLTTFATRAAGEARSLPPGACGTCGDPAGPGACSPG